MSADLAKLLKLEKGKFYCIYKPSFANYKYEHAFVTQSYSPNEEEPDREIVRKYPNVAD